MTRRSPVLLVCVTLLLAAVASSAQESAWERHIAAGRQASQQGRFAEAEQHFTAALQEAEGFGPRDLRLAEILHLLANLRLSAGDFRQAEPLCQRALSIREEVLGAEHPLVAESLNLLAAVYHLEGERAAAEPLYLRALRIREAAMGPWHPDVAQSCNNLADLYRLLGKTEQAESLYRRALEILEKSYGPADPQLAVTLNNMATLYYGEGQYAQAEPLYLRALAIGGKSLGMQDPSLAATLVNLSALYRAQRRYSEAIPLQHWALAVWETTLGTSHPLYQQFAAQNQQAREMHNHATHGTSTFDEAEMGAPDEAAPITLSDVLSRQGMNEFALEYFSAGSDKRPVFEKHFDALGANGILDFLEAANPMCHEQAHELGQVVLAHSKSVGAALRQCLTRCTSACMHGILKGALAEKRAGAAHPGAPSVTEEIARGMAALCQEPEMIRIHKPGNCAHGMGHAFLMNTGYDLGSALTSCSAFEELPMQYQCATGVFMEYLVTGRPPEPRLSELHFPCDTYARFPAACYRYKVAEMIRMLGEDRSKAVAECLVLPGPRRLGCFHGIGAAYIRAIFNDPRLVGEVCKYGTPDDQTICIEGAIEKLAEYDEPHALAACATLEGKPATICRAAAAEKMYRLTKPSLPLYTDQ